MYTIVYHFDNQYYLGLSSYVLNKLYHVITCRGNHNIECFVKVNLCQHVTLDNDWTMYVVFNNSLITCITNKTVCILSVTESLRTKSTASISTCNLLYSDVSEVIFGNSLRLNHLLEFRCLTSHGNTMRHVIFNSSCLVRWVRRIMLQFVLIA